MHLVAPSALAADFAKLEESLSIVNNSEADLLHVDVMDGVFVPNISFGQDIVKTMKRVCEKPLDVHLMIVQPEKFITSFAECGASRLTVHYEACDHLHSVVQQIKAKDMLAGVALNPHTSVNLLDDVLEELDQVILMSVNPGFGGQKFIYQTINKIKQLKEKISVRNLKTEISIDGGVGLQNAEKILQAGADILIAGSSVFKADKPNEAIAKLKAIRLDTFL